MFRKKPGKAIEVTKLSSLIADNVHIVGDVVFSGGLRVDGHIEGNVINKDGSPGLLVVSEKGSIKGRVVSHDAVVNGAIAGELTVHHFLELQSKARLSGVISYRQLQMECGATLEGELRRLDDAAHDAKVVELPAQQHAGGR